MHHSPGITNRFDLIVVEVSNTQAHLTIDPAWIERIVRVVLQSEAVGRASLSIGITDNASIRVINARYLAHDWPTDVITFPDPGEETAGLAGEIVISAEMAAEEAVLARCDPLDEVALYLVHGLLHLCDYDDQSVADAVLIRRREAEILCALDIENPFDRVDQSPAWSEESGRESVRWPR